MSNTFKNNAYHVLGLDTSANQKSIIKRSKEILKLLEIDNPPEYPLDLNFFNNFRTEESVKDAIQKLQTPKKKIKEYFFWFQIEEDVDKEAEELLSNNDYQSALKTWESSSSKSVLCKKNLAILMTL